jgi:hypothetical protein
MRGLGDVLALAHLGIIRSLIRIGCFSVEHAVVFNLRVLEARLIDVGHAVVELRKLPPTLNGFSLFISHVRLGVTSHCSRIVVVVSLPDTIRDLRDSLNVALLADKDHVSLRSLALAGHRVTAFNTSMKTVRFSRHTILSRVRLSLFLVTGHQAPLLGYFLDVSELRFPRRLLGIACGRVVTVQRLSGAEGLVSYTGAFSFLKGHVFKSLLTQINLVIVQQNRRCVGQALLI